MCEMCRERLTDGVRDWRSVIHKPRESRTQRAFTRRPQLATDRVIVMQVGCA